VARSSRIVAAGDANCVHATVVGFPGGFSAPNFCVPALGYTVSVTQTGCGAGQIDSDGGSDYKIEELNDTSDTQNAIARALVPQRRAATGVGTGTCTGACGLPQAGAPSAPTLQRASMSRSVAAPPPASVRAAQTQS
jgi:putative intracellular protease/amidase